MSATVNIDATLKTLRSLEGYLGACVVDSESGMALGIDGGTPEFDIELAAASNTEVVRAKRKAMVALRLDDVIDDILLTLGRQYHLIRPLRARPAIFIYIALDRARANLAMARMVLKDAEKQLDM